MKGFETARCKAMVSIAIVSLFLMIGMLLSGVIDGWLKNRYQDYDKALQIVDDAELFDQAMRTCAGYAFVQGELRAVDPVSIPDIPGEYGYIIKIRQRQRRHTRTFTNTDSKGHTHTRIQTYRTWHDEQTWRWHCEQISFLGHHFPYGTIHAPSARYIDTIYESSQIRYVYYACAAEYTGTLWARLGDSEISETVFYEGQDIGETISWLESGWEKIVFWIVWMLLMGLAILGFHIL